MSEPSRSQSSSLPSVAGEDVRVVSHRPSGGAGQDDGGPIDIDQLAHCSDVIGLNATSTDAVTGWRRELDGWRGFAGSHEDAHGSAPGNVVLWRESAFARLADGQLAIPGTPAPVTWVRLQHRDSGVVLTWVQCELDPDVQAASMGTLLDLVRSAGEVGEVLVAGDWGRCARAARERPHPSSPFAVLEQGDDPSLLPGLRSTYSFFGFTTPATSGPVDQGEYRHHVAVLRRTDPAQRVLAFGSHRVLSQFPSDHRPIRAVVQVHTGRTESPLPKERT